MRTVERGSREQAKDKTRGRMRVGAGPRKEEGGGENDRNTVGQKGSEGGSIRGLMGKRKETNGCRL